ncbi:hypothetical protein GCM10009854_42360 [Saccharopolyspora halophila]|uniref:DUF397 domain-containing protein n=1 Tax=Saccharopolyspora halophila TaxID=405551 RepID=A0ABN3GRZ7_9PSEU
MSTQPEWRKSSRSNGGGQCVEVATNVPDAALIRDSKLGDESPILSAKPEVFASFIQAIKDGKLGQ